MEHDLYFISCPNDFWHKRKIYNFDPYNVFLSIATNIPQRLKTGFVVQGHIFSWSVLSNLIMLSVCLLNINFKTLDFIVYYLG